MHLDLHQKASLELNAIADIEVNPCHPRCSVQLRWAKVKAYRLDPCTAGSLIPNVKTSNAAG